MALNGGVGRILQKKKIRALPSIKAFRFYTTIENRERWPLQSVGLRMFDMPYFFQVVRYLQTGDGLQKTTRRESEGGRRIHGTNWFRTGKQGCGPGDGLCLVRTCLFNLLDPETDQCVNTRKQAKHRVLSHGSAAVSKCFEATNCKKNKGFLNLFACWWKETDPYKHNGSGAGMPKTYGAIPEHWYPPPYT
jgi:hypothetical protein